MPELDLPSVTAPRAPGRFFGWTQDDLERFNRVRQVLWAPVLEPAFFRGCERGRSLQAAAVTARGTLHNWILRRDVPKQDADQLEKVRTRIVAFIESAREECCMTCRRSAKNRSAKQPG